MIDRLRSDPEQLRREMLAQEYRESLRVVNAAAERELSDTARELRAIRHVLERIANAVEPPR